MLQVDDKLCKTVLILD